MHGPIHQPLHVHRCAFTWTLSKTSACAFPQTAWERWMDNTWKSLLDDGLDAGLMNNWLFTYQYILLFSCQDCRIIELKKTASKVQCGPSYPSLAPSLSSLQGHSLEWISQVKSFPCTPWMRRGFIMCFGHRWRCSLKVTFCEGTWNYISNTQNAPPPHADLNNSVTLDSSADGTCKSANANQCGFIAF